MDKHRFERFLAPIERFQESEGGDGRTVTGYAIRWGVSNGRPGYDWQLNERGEPEGIEYQDSIFEAGCFADWLASDGARRIRYLWAHGLDKPLWGGMGVTALPVGVIKEMQDDGSGLLYTARLLDTQRGRELAEAIREKAVTENSVTAHVTERHFVSTEDGNRRRVVTKAELWDISPVVWAAIEGSDMAETYCHACSAPLAGAQHSHADAREKPVVLQPVGELSRAQVRAQLTPLRALLNAANANSTDTLQPFIELADRALENLEALAKEKEAK